MLDANYANYTYSDARLDYEAWRKKLCDAFYCQGWLSVAQLADRMKIPGTMYSWLAHEVEK